MATTQGAAQTLWLEWAADFQLNQVGSLQLASGWDQIRQQFERLLLTNPAVLLANGFESLADYIFEPLFGLGLPKYEGQLEYPTTFTAMEQTINQAAKADPNIATSPAPVVTITPSNPGVVEIYIDLWLANQTPGTIALQLGGN